MKRIAVLTGALIAVFPYGFVQVERPPMAPAARIRIWAQMDGCKVYQVSFRNDFMGYFVKCGEDPAFRLGD